MPPSPGAPPSPPERDACDDIRYQRLLTLLPVGRNVCRRRPLLPTTVPMFAVINAASSPNIFTIEREREREKERKRVREREREGGGKILDD